MYLVLYPLGILLLFIALVMFLAKLIDKRLKDSLTYFSIAVPIIIAAILFLISNSNITSNKNTFYLYLLITILALFISKASPTKTLEIADKVRLISVSNFIIALIPVIILFQMQLDAKFPLVVAFIYFTICVIMFSLFSIKSKLTRLIIIQSLFLIIWGLIFSIASYKNFKFPYQIYVFLVAIAFICLILIDVLMLYEDTEEYSNNYSLLCVSSLISILISFLELNFKKYIFFDLILVVILSLLAFIYYVYTSYKTKNLTSMRKNKIVLLILLITILTVSVNLTEYLNILNIVVIIFFIIYSCIKALKSDSPDDYTSVMSYSVILSLTNFKYSSLTACVIILGLFIIYFIKMKIQN